MGLVIRKRVSLKFLGEEYKDGYIVFRAIPVTDLPAINNDMPTEEDTKEEQLKAVPKMVEILKKYFLNGKSPNEKGELEDVLKEDLDNLDSNAAVECFKGLTGVDENLESASEISSDQ